MAVEAALSACSRDRPDLGAPLLVRGQSACAGAAGRRGGRAEWGQVCWFTPAPKGRRAALCWSGEAGARAVTLPRSLTCGDPPGPGEALVAWARLHAGAGQHLVLCAGADQRRAVAAALRVANQRAYIGLRRGGGWSGVAAGWAGGGRLQQAAQGWCCRSTAGSARGPASRDPSPARTRPLGMRR